MIDILYFLEGVGSILWAQHFRVPYPRVFLLLYTYCPLGVCPGMISTDTVSSLWFLSSLKHIVVHECNVFLQCCITLGPARQFSLQNVKLSRIVTYRSKIIRVNCSLNWSYINLLWRIELWLSKPQLSVFLKIVWVFWLEHVVPPLVIALNKLNSL